MKGRLFKTYDNKWYVCNEVIHLEVIEPETLTFLDEGKLVECKVITKLIYDALKYRSIEVPYYAQITHHIGDANEMVNQVPDVREMVENDVEYLADEFLKKDLQVASNTINRAVKLGYIEGYNKAKETMYTEEQVKKAIEMALDLERTVEMYEIIKSLKK